MQRSESTLLKESQDGVPASGVAIHRIGKGHFYTAKISSPEVLNTAILDGFHKHLNDPDVRKTHFFQGRFENIYIAPELIPPVAVIVAEATNLAQQILSNPKNLKSGYWFNAMYPENETLAHSHDDDEELLSGVYYVEVPENSGQLLLGNGVGACAVIPQAGNFVFFKPDLTHAVERHCGEGLRLSIGMNFGQ